MDFYASLGFLVFGSRLRRLSERFLADVNRIYENAGLSFDASWFPVFYILSQREAVSIRDISNELAVSHSAVSQLVSSLQQKGLLRTGADVADGRRKVVSFTAKGKRLQQQALPIWQALEQSMKALAGEGRHSAMVLDAIQEMEQAMTDRSVFDRVQEQLEQGQP